MMSIQNKTPIPSYERYIIHIWCDPIFLNPLELHHPLYSALQLPLSHTKSSEQSSSEEQVAPKPSV